MKFVGYVMHFNTAQPILTKLGGDMHRVMGKCIGYIARAARVRNGRAQRAEVILRVFAGGFERACVFAFNGWLPDARAARSLGQRRV